MILSSPVLYQHLLFNGIIISLLQFILKLTRVLCFWITSSKNQFNYVSIDWFCFSNNYPNQQYNYSAMHKCICHLITIYIYIYNVTFTMLALLFTWKEFFFSNIIKSCILNWWSSLALSMQVDNKNSYVYACVAPNREITIITNKGTHMLLCF